MVRKFLCAMAAIVACVGILLADELKGKVTAVDGEKGVLTVNVDGKDRKVKLGKDVKISGKASSLKDIKEGANVTIVYEKDGKKMIYKEVKVD